MKRFLILSVLVLGVSMTGYSQTVHSLYTQSMKKSLDGKSLLEQAEPDIRVIKKGDHIELPQEFGFEQPMLIVDHTMNGNSGSLLGYSEKGSFVLTYMKGKVTSNIIHKLDGQVFIIKENLNGYVVEETQHSEEGLSCGMGHFENWGVDEDALSEQAEMGEGAITGGMEMQSTLPESESGVQTVIDVQIGFDPEEYDYLTYNAKLKSLIHMMTDYDNAGGIAGCPEYNGIDPNNYFDQYTINEMINTCNAWVMDLIEASIQPEDVVQNWLTSWSAQVNEGFASSLLESIRVNFMSIYRSDTTLYREKLNATELTGADLTDYIAYDMVLDALYDHAPLKNRMDAIGADLHVQVTSTLGLDFNAGRGTFPKWTQYGGVDLARSAYESSLLKVPVDHGKWKSSSLWLIKSDFGRAAPTQIYPGSEFESDNFALGFHVFASTAGGSNLELVPPIPHPSLNWDYIVENCREFGGTLEDRYSFDGSENDSCIIKYLVYDDSGTYGDPSIELIRASSTEGALFMHEFGHNLGLRHGRTHAKDDEVVRDINNDGVAETIVFKNPLKDGNGNTSMRADEYTSNERFYMGRGDYSVIGSRQNVGMAACVARNAGWYSRADNPARNLSSLDWFDTPAHERRYVNPINQEFSATNICFSSIMHYAQGTEKIRAFSSERIFLKNTLHEISGSGNLFLANWTIARHPLDSPTETLQTYALPTPIWRALQSDGGTFANNYFKFVPLGLPDNKVSAASYLPMGARMVSSYRNRTGTSTGYLIPFLLPEIELPEGRNEGCGNFLYTGILQRIALPCNFFEEIAQFVHPSKLVSFSFPFRNVTNVMQEVAVSMTPVQRAQMSKTLQGNGDNISVLFDFDEDTLASDPVLETSSGWLAYPEKSMEISTTVYASENQSLKIFPLVDTTVVHTPYFIDYDEGKIDIAFELRLDANSDSQIDRYSFYFTDIGSNTIGGIRFDYGLVFPYDPTLGDYQYSPFALKVNEFQTIEIAYDPMEQTLIYSLDGRVIYTAEDVTSFKPARGTVTALEYYQNSTLYLDDVRIYRNQYSAVADLIPTHFYLEPGQTQMVEVTFDPTLLDTETLAGYSLTTKLDGVDILETPFTFAKSTEDELEPPVLLTPEDEEGNVALSPKLTWEHKTGSLSQTGYRVLVSERSTDVSFTAGNVFTPLPQYIVYEDTVTETSFTLPDGTLEQGTEYLWQVTPVYYGYMSGTSSAVGGFTTEASKLGSLTLKVDSLYTIPNSSISFDVFVSEKLPSNVSAFQLNILVPEQMSISSIASALEDTVQIAYEISNAFKPSSDALIPGTSLTLSDVEYTVADLTQYATSYKVVRIAMASGSSLQTAGPLVNFRARFSEAGTYKLFPFSGLFNADVIQSYAFDGIYVDDQILGDIDGNGKIQANDAASILHYLVDSDYLDNFPWDWRLLKAADFNNDGQIRALDAGRILSAVVSETATKTVSAVFANTADSVSITAAFENGVLKIQNESGDLRGLELSIGDAELLKIGEVLSDFTYATNIVNDTLKVAIASAESMQKELVSIDITPGENKIPLTIIANVTSDSVVVTGQTGTSVDPGSELPAEFALYQNYPNPFNPTTVIGFDLPKATVVTLEVYNVMGQRVMTLLEAKSTQAGRHSVSIDASGLSSGLYMYKLSAGEFQQVRSMMLIR